MLLMYRFFVHYCYIQVVQQLQVMLSSRHFASPRPTKVASRDMTGSAPSVSGYLSLHSSAKSPESLPVGFVIRRLVKFVVSVCNERGYYYCLDGSVWLHLLEC